MFMLAPEFAPLFPGPMNSPFTEPEKDALHFVLRYCAIDCDNEQCIYDVLEGAVERARAAGWSRTLAGDRLDQMIEVGIRHMLRDDVDEGTGAPLDAEQRAYRRGVLAHCPWAALRDLVLDLAIWKQDGDPRYAFARAFLFGSADDVAARLVTAIRDYRAAGGDLARYGIVAPDGQARIDALLLPYGPLPRLD